jgi:transcriptional regulator with XRE-family HTH domain
MNIEIANRLMELRKKNGYSQEQLADKLGISRQSVSKWERAESSPDTDNLICLAGLYGVSLDSLLKTDEKTEDIAKEEAEKQTQSSSPASDGDKDEDDEQDTEDQDEYSKALKELSPADYQRGEQIHARRKAVVAWVVEGSIWVLTLAAYFIASVLTALYHPLWIIFLAPIVISASIDAIIEKKISDFACFPVLVTAVYLALGFTLNLWHPYWFLFILIPVWYVLTGYIDTAINTEQTKMDRRIIRYYRHHLNKGSHA